MNAADISTLDIGAWSELWNSLNGQSLGFTLKELMERFMGTGAMMRKEYGKGSLPQ